MIVECPKCGSSFDNEGKNRYIKKFCSRKCANSRIFSVESRRKKSLANQEKRFPDRRYRPPQKETTRDCIVCKIPFTTVGAKAKVRQTCSEKCLIASNGRGGFRLNSTRKIRTEYKNFWMDSGAELKFAVLLDEHNIEWVKNTTVSFSYIDNTGKNRKYYPDFYLPAFNHWVEIKGKYYMTENDPLKLNAVSSIEMIFSDDIRLPRVVEPADIA